MRAIINADIYDYTHFRPKSYVLYDSKIRKVGPMSEYESLKDSIEHTLDFKNSLLMPGHIVGHGHIYSVFARGLKLSPLAPETFTQRLRQFWWRIDAEYDLEATYHSSQVLGVESIKSGVTTFFDHHASSYVRGSLNAIKSGIVDEIGMRAMLCLETSDRFDVDECITENVNFAKNNQGERCRGLFGIHASLTVSQKTLAKIADRIDGIPLHVHVGESLEEELESLNLYGMRSTLRYESFDLLSPGSLLAHCTNVNEKEAEIIAKRDCMAVLNPTANLNANNGIPNYDLLRNQGVSVIIGSDSLGTNITKEYQNMYYIMQTGLNDRTMLKFSHNDLIQCIMNGYEYASRMFGVRLGRIEDGYEADFISVPYQVSTDINEENAFAYLMSDVYNRFIPRDVIVGGEIKMQDYQTIYDEERIYAQSREAAKIHWSKMKG